MDEDTASFFGINLHHMPTTERRSISAPACVQNQVPMRSNFSHATETGFCGNDLEGDAKTNKQKKSTAFDFNPPSFEGVL